MTRRIAVLHTAAAVLCAAALAATLWRGLQQPAIALAFGLVIAAGEMLRVRLPGRDHSMGALGSAGALGYALLGEVGSLPCTHDVPQVVAVTVTASLVGQAPHIARGRAPTLDRSVRGVLTVTFAATCFRPLHSSGMLDGWFGQGPPFALALLAVLALTGLCDALIGAVFASGRTGRRFGPVLREQLRAVVGIVPAIAATGAVIALAVGVAGLWALPVFCVPLLLTQLSFRRYAAVRATYRQTIASLARSTEVAGYTPHGHARRVASTSRAVGRELGLAEPELTVLEYAALMHDIGQLSLLDPVAAGATEPLSEAERRRIAQLGGAVVRQTGVPEEVALVVEAQADPFREQPVTARIVRAVNAYEDLLAQPEGAPGGIAGPLLVLERLRLGSARDYDPRVVEALALVVCGDTRATGGPS